MGERARHPDARRAVLDEVEAAVRRRLASKPRRLAHSLAVADTAERLAVRYGVDAWEARLAGTLHDWDKALDRGEQLAKARAQGVDMGVDLELVVPLLHGITAAGELPGLFPDLPPAVFQAIRRHTVGAVDMTPLDMVVFVADGIEPHRPDVTAVATEREMVAAGAALEDVYWMSFFNGIAYVIETERYLYPGTLDIYNTLVRRRQGRGRHAR